MQWKSLFRIIYAVILNIILNIEINYWLTVSATGTAAFAFSTSVFINERNVEDLMSEFALAERHIDQNVNAKMVFFDLTLKVIMLLKR